MANNTVLLRTVAILIIVVVAYLILSRLKLPEVKPNKITSKSVQRSKKVAQNVDPLHQLEFHNLFTHIIDNSTELSDAERTFHEYVTNIEVTCPVSVELGRAENRGWWPACLVPPYNFQEPCLVYSFGINNDWSFDDDMTKRYKCKLRAFDPSMNAEDHRRGEHIWFYKLGIGGKDVDPAVVSTKEDGWRLKTFTSFLKHFSEINSIVDYLKIDVEYSEWTSLNALINEAKQSGVRLLSNVKQLGIEIHTKEMFLYTRPNESSSRTSMEDFLLYTHVLGGLQAAGFRRWYFHSNPHHFKSRRSEKVGYCCCYEMAFININYL